MNVESESSANASESVESVDLVAAAGAATGPVDNPEETAGESVPAVAVVLSPEEMDCYECRSCGYSYEPTKGDSRAKIAMGTAFEDLPLNWRCPVCSAPKKQFNNIGPVNSPSGFKENLDYGLGVNRLTPGQKNILIFGALALGFMFFLSLYGLK
ncbi:MAG: rubredoxin [Leptolyngbya sp. DLM2.Bin27]|nr:MAG: rubredoxin [Leptolyngbya sp. DLM2.Bin27]